MIKRAICVGINDYPGDDYDLYGCVNDAFAWSLLLSKDYGFDRTIELLDFNATKSKILNNLSKNLEELGEEDVFVFTYSGHGTQVKDTSGDEEDLYDEALYVYDDIILDDELREIFSKAKCTLVVIIDSCFSGTATRAPLLVNTRLKYVGNFPTAKSKKSFLSEEDMVEILISGANDKEYAYDAYIDGDYFGAFSYYALKSIRADLDATYIDFYNTLRGYLPSKTYPQTPQLEGKEENKSRGLFSAKVSNDPEGCLIGLLKSILKGG